MESVSNKIYNMDEISQFDKNLGALTEGLMDVPGINNK